MKGLASANIKCERPLHFKEKVKHMKTYGLHYSSSLCSLAFEFKWNYELMSIQRKLIPLECTKFLSLGPLKNFFSLVLNSTEKMYVSRINKVSFDKPFENTGSQLLPQRKKLSFYVLCTRKQIKMFTDPKVLSEQMFTSSTLIVQGHMNLQAGMGTQLVTRQYQNTTLSH